MGLIFKPKPGPTFIFEARFTPEIQIYRVSQGMRNWVTKNVVYGIICRQARTQGGMQGMHPPHQT